MKKIIWIFIFLIILNTVAASPYITTINPPLNNTAEDKTLLIRFQTPDLFDFENSTGRLELAQGTGMVGYEYLCSADGENASIDACWSTQTNAVASSENIFAGTKSIKVQGANSRIIFDPPSTQIDLTCEMYMANNLTGPSNTMTNSLIYDAGRLEFLDDNAGMAGNFSADLDPGDIRTRLRTTYCGGGSADCGASKKWTYWKADAEKGTHFILGNNWTAIANGSQILSHSYTNKADLIQGPGTSATTYFDNIKCYNNTPTLNASASILAYKTVSVKSFNQVSAFWYGNLNGVEILFNCNNNTPTQKITTNASPTPTQCANSQISQQLTVWINLTSSTANVTYLNITVSTGADTTPPSITYYNLTSNDNGCESWNTDKNTACSTSLVTPAVQFNTSENAWCAIAGSSSSTSLNLNYTEMGSSRNCTDAVSGEGTREHFCTLTNQDELVYDTSYLFISCKDSSNNQNSTSTSSALKLSITGLETAGRNSIGLGIQNALLNSYTNYTDLQIYARNLSNAQVKGTFDRAAKKGTKLWAFNRIGVSDSHVNMFNLTPVLYTLELANKTSSNITLQVEQLINTTK